MTTWTFDKVGYDRKVRQFAALQRRDLGAVIRDEARLAVIECAERTPPFDGAKMKGGGKAAGERAVRRDVRKVFVDAKSLDLWNDSKSYRNAVLKGQVGVIEKILQNAKRFGGAAMLPTRRHHREQRDRRGRVRQGGKWQAIIGGQAIDQYLGWALRRVGYARSGWNKAASQFGAAVPGWAARHSAPGHVADHTRGTETPIAECANTLRWIQEAGRRLRIVEWALKAREKNLEAKINREVSKSFLEANV
jgi:hypothetical protein